jgi:hypothetical protein
MQHQSISAAVSGEILYGSAAVAAFLGVAVRHVGLLARDRGLPLHMVGSHKMATKREVLAWLEALPLAASGRGGR